MALLTTTANAYVVASRDGVDPVPSVAASVGGDTFTNTGSELLIVKNAAGAPINVTVVTTQTVDGLAVADKVVSVTNGTTRSLGPWPRAVYGSTVSVTYSAVTSITVKVLQMTPEPA
jgi:hypothetical protein